MLGNDVVDLGDPETADRHRRFDARVFHPTERALIDASPTPARTRWLLWAAKESAYKAARKADPRTVFTPSRFVVRVEDGGHATVDAGNRAFRAEVASGPHVVHVVAHALDDAPGGWCAAVTTCPPGVSPSDAVRRLAIARLAAHLDTAPDDLAIRRDGRIPAVWIGGIRSNADLSLAHHGRFVAFACRLP